MKRDKTILKNFKKEIRLSTRVVKSKKIYSKKDRFLAKNIKMADFGL